jgi:hypothetical protein
MRDRIAELLDAAEMEYRATGEGPSSYSMADKIIAALPSMVAPLAFQERRHGYWGSTKDSYQIAHTNGEMFRVRLGKRVICRDIKGFGKAVRWANARHVDQIISAFAPPEAKP